MCLLLSIACEVYCLSLSNCNNQLQISTQRHSIIHPLCPMATISSRLAVVAQKDNIPLSILFVQWQNLLQNSSIGAQRHDSPLSITFVQLTRDELYRQIETLHSIINPLCPMVTTDSQSSSSGTQRHEIPLSILYGQWQQSTLDLQYWHIEA